MTKVWRGRGATISKAQSQVTDAVSVYELNEASGAGVLDTGPAQIHALTGGPAWTDREEESLVTGDAGTSFYKTNAAHLILPANAPAHTLNALTLVFYYQDDGSPARAVLCAGSAALNTVAGDFSIEAQTTGELRAYHVGQDGELRFFGDNTNGIPGTNLRDGNAHRIALALGDQGGARIYLDDTLEATIAENTNGWNNTREKFFGTWPDGSSNPAYGAFDRISVYNRPLSTAEIQALPAANTVTLGGTPPVTGDAPLAPSLAEWLVSDEAGATPDIYAKASATGSGDGSSEANAMSLSSALSAVSGGEVIQYSCATPGTIEFADRTSGITLPNGSSGNYTTIQCKNGDGLVISKGEDFAGARTPDNGFWTQSGLSSDDISKNIWRSVSTFSGGEENMMGWWREFDQPHQIVRAGSMTTLRLPRIADGEGGTEAYGGPCVHKASDGRVYIRWQRGHDDRYSYHQKWSQHTWPGFPEAVSNGRLVYPLSNDPNDYEIYMTRITTTTSAFNVGQWVKIGAGINSMGHTYAFSNNSSHIWLDRGLHYCRSSFNQPSTSGAQISDVFCNRTRCSDGSKIHMSRAEWKFEGWLEGAGPRSGCWRMLNSASMSQIFCLDCTFGHWHEMVVGEAGWDQLRFRNCAFVSGLDDGWQTPASQSRVEFGYCYFLNSAWGGDGRGGGEGTTVGPLGQWFFHHNILDNRQERCTDWMSEPHPGFLFLSHSPNHNNPRKMYNNLFIVGPDLEQEQGGVGLGHCEAGGGSSGENNTATGTANMHEVFNNIVLRVHLEGTKRYDPAAGNNYSFSLQDQTDWVIGRAIKYSAAFTNELFDYNLYWRPSSMTVNAFLQGYRRGAGQTPITNYSTLAAWKASGEFEHSKLGGTYRGAYSPGFDGNTTDVKPTMGTLDNYPTERFTGYRPAAETQVTTAASGSLSGANWWSGDGPTWGRTYFGWNDGIYTLGPDEWKGPLDPSPGSPATMPVGVQNP